MKADKQKSLVENVEKVNTLENEISNILEKIKEHSNNVKDQIKKITKK